MKLFIHSINKKRKLFYCILNNKKTAFYLPNRLARTFLPIIEPGLLVDFEVAEETVKKVNDTITYMYPVLYFNKITNITGNRVLYDLNSLRKDMKKVVSTYNYYLFLDFEMTMPGYKKGYFNPEIIDIGLVLTNNEGKMIKTLGYYLMPSDPNKINRRTVKFLKLDEDLFMKHAKPYKTFYKDFKNLINKYKPKMVVWGKNDIQALDYSYELYKLPKLSTQADFIDLLKLHKDYYNLANDIKLFDVYKTYYEVKEELVQTHSAKTDALVTKEVFDAFLKYI